MAWTIFVSFCNETLWYRLRWGGYSSSYSPEFDFVRKLYTSFLPDMRQFSCLAFLLYHYEWKGLSPEGRNGRKTANFTEGETGERRGWDERKTRAPATWGPSRDQARRGKSNITNINQYWWIGLVKNDQKWFKKIKKQCAPRTRNEAKDLWQIE